MTTVVERFVEFASGLRHEALPDAVSGEAKRLLLDSVGCALAAHGTDKGRIAVKVATDMAGPPEATIIGGRGRQSMAAAAFANGELITTLDYDALISPPGHVAPYVIPAAIAAAEKHGRSGPDLIVALVAAHEISARFGYAMADPRSVAPGEKITFPAISGYSSTVFGGTLGAAMLVGLTPAESAHALGLAGHIAPTQSMGKWVRTLPATMDKYVMAGWISQAELLAVALAAGGYTGDVSVLEGDHGFWKFMGSGRWVPEPLVDRLGETWRLPAAAIYKPYAHCRISQTVFDCLGSVMREHDLAVDEIERIDAWCDPHGALLPMWSTKDIRSCLDAQMSVPFGVSLVAHGVPNGPVWQSAGTIANPRYLAFMDKVTVRAHPDFEATIRQEPGSRIGKVDVFARGRTFSEERKYRKGSPATPQTRMSDDELEEKFRVNAAGVLSTAAIDELAHALRHLEDVGDIAQLARLWRVQDQSDAPSPSRGVER